MTLCMITGRTLVVKIIQLITRCVVRICELLSMLLFYVVRLFKASYVHIADVVVDS